VVWAEGIASVFFGMLILASGLTDAQRLMRLLAPAVAASIVAHSSTDVVAARWLRVRPDSPTANLTLSAPLPNYSRVQSERSMQDQLRTVVRISDVTCEGEGSIVRWASWTNVVLGGWLMLAPRVLGYYAIVPTIEDSVLGAAVLIIALWSANTDRMTTGTAWTNAVLGIWVVIAPWLLGYQNFPLAVANEMFTGILIVAFSITRAAAGTTTAGPPTPTRTA
jgi:hypothetical protein